MFLLNRPLWFKSNMEESVYESLSRPYHVECVEAASEGPEATLSKAWNDMVGDDVHCEEHLQVIEKGNAHRADAG